MGAPEGEALAESSDGATSADGGAGRPLWATASAAGASANAGCATAAEENANALCWGYCCRSQNCFRWPNTTVSGCAPSSMYVIKHVSALAMRSSAYAVQPRAQKC